MKKQLTNKTIYVPNRGVKLTVTNKPIFDEERGQIAGYDVDVTVKIKRNLMPQELKFGSDDDIAEFMGGIDFDDPQQELPLGK